MNRILFIAQRATALLLGPLVIVHLGLVIFAVRNGLSAEEILARTQGNTVWAVFYTAFVVTVSIHAPIGLRNVLKEWTPLDACVVNTMTILFSLLLLALGLRAVIAVTTV
jgi:fumarate reductase subunit C